MDIRAAAALLYGSDPEAMLLRKVQREAALRINKEDCDAVAKSLAELDSKGSLFAAAIKASAMAIQHTARVSDVDDQTILTEQGP